MSAPGPVNGGNHFTQSFLLSGGKSLHPLQRAGQVGVAGFPSIGVPRLPGFSTAPPAAGSELSMPHILTPGISHNPAVRV